MSMVDMCAWMLETEMVANFLPVKGEMYSSNEMLITFL